MSNTNRHLNRLILYQRITLFTFCKDPATGLPAELMPVRKLADH
jgi:hypothetical protein